MAPASDPISGNLRLYQMGNVTQDTFYILKNLREGEYFWSVQAISPSLEGSEFAPEQTFTFSITGVGESKPGNHVSVWPNPTSGILHIEISESRNFELVDLTGRQYLKDRLQPGTNTLNLSSLSKGVYFLKVGDDLIKVMKR